MTNKQNTEREFQWKFQSAVNVYATHKRINDTHIHLCMHTQYTAHLTGMDGLLVVVAKKGFKKHQMTAFNVLPFTYFYDTLFVSRLPTQRLPRDQNLRDNRGEQNEEMKKQKRVILLSGAGMHACSSSKSIYTCNAISHTYMRLKSYWIKKTTTNREHSHCH